MRLGSDVKRWASEKSAGVKRRPQTTNRGPFTYQLHIGIGLLLNEVHHGILQCWQRGRLRKRRTEVQPCEEKWEDMNEEFGDPSTASPCAFVCLLMS